MCISYEDKMLKLITKIFNALEWVLDQMSPDFVHMNRKQIDNYLGQSENLAELETRQRELMRRGVI